MMIFDYIKTRIELFRKRRELKRIRQFLFVLDDQVKSGQASIRYWEARQHQLHAEIALLTPPDEIVRRGVQV